MTWEYQIILKIKNKIREPCGVRDRPPPLLYICQTERWTLDLSVRTRDAYYQFLGIQKASISLVVGGQSQVEIPVMSCDTSFPTDNLWDQKDLSKNRTSGQSGTAGVFLLSDLLSGVNLWVKIQSSRLKFAQTERETRAASGIKWPRFSHTSWLRNLHHWVLTAREASNFFRLNIACLRCAGSLPHSRAVCDSFVV